MEGEQKVGTVQLSARLRGVSPPVARRLRVAEQTSLAALHAARGRGSSLWMRSRRGQPGWLKAPQTEKARA